MKLTREARAVFEAIEASPDAKVPALMKASGCTRNTTRKWKRVWDEHDGDVPGYRSTGAGRDFLKTFPPGVRPAGPKPLPPGAPGAPTPATPAPVPPPGSTASPAPDYLQPDYDPEPRRLRRVEVRL